MAVPAFDGEESMGNGLPAADAVFDGPDEVTSGIFGAGPLEDVFAAPWVSEGRDMTCFELETPGWLSISDGNELSSCDFAEVAAAFDETAPDVPGNGFGGIVTEALIESVLSGTLLEMTSGIETTKSDDFGFGELVTSGFPTSLVLLERIGSLVVVASSWRVDEPPCVLKMSV